MAFKDKREIEVFVENMFNAMRHVKEKDKQIPERIFGVFYETPDYKVKSVGFFTRDQYLSVKKELTLQAQRMGVKAVTFRYERCGVSEELN